jgi:hypothetical protein
MYSTFRLPSQSGVIVGASNHKKSGPEFISGVLVLFWLLFWLSPVFGESSNPRFAGVEITVGVQNVSAIGAPAKAHAQTWEQRTGGKVYSGPRKSDRGLS